MQQFILPLIPQNSYHLDEFIVTSCNKAAYDIITKCLLPWGVQPYPCSLLLYGPPSSGKTYLTKIWQNLSKAYQITNGDFSMQDHPAFIIENIDVAWQEDSLLHHFNLINETGKHVLMTTSTTHNNFKLPDLASRINAVYKTKILSPDDELIRILLFKHFSDKSIKVQEQVIDFLLMRLPRQFDKIIELAEKINIFALTHKRSITIPLVKEVISPIL